MNSRVVEVKANDDFTLKIKFTTGEVRLFNARPYLTKGIFKELLDIHIFKTAKVFDGTVQWIHEQDLCPDTLYEKSLPVE